MRAPADGERPAVFLDRDGVLNRAEVRNGRPLPPATAHALQIIPGAADACRRLRQAGFMLVVVTNQPDLARGTLHPEEAAAINLAVRASVDVDDLRVCPHDDADGCRCRKPSPGLILDAARDHAIDLSRSFMVGDRWRDIEAGRRAGCSTLLVDNGWAERRPDNPDVTVADLAEAADWICGSLRDKGDRLTMTATDIVTTSSRHSSLQIKVFADGADRDSMLALAGDPAIRGFTTNPTLMRQAGVTDYEAFAREILVEITDRPISFEVFSDDFDEMERQAMKIAGWGTNVNVKIPVTNTAGQSSAKLIRRLSEDGVRLNVTALMTLSQVRTVAECLEGGPGAIVSVFAGRIADTGRDPVPLMSAALELVRPYGNIELLWASPREVLNIIQADAIGCHIITVTHDLLKKLRGLGKDLQQFSLETVKMFHTDARTAGYVL